MEAPLARRQLWIAGGTLAALLLIGCSLNLDYLKRGPVSADSGVGGLADAPADTSSASEAGFDAASDALVATDATTGTIDTGGDAPMASDGMEAQDGDQDAIASDGGTVASNLLANPTFDQGLAGWTLVPAVAAGKYAFIQAPIGSSTTPQGQGYELATYSSTDAFTVQVSQTLSNLPDGTYMFTGFFNRGTDNQAYIFAKGCGGPAQQVNIPLSTPTGWDQVSIPSIPVTGGACQVGFFVDSSATNWLNADGFTFQLVTFSSPPGDGGAE